jgi:aquaporin-3
LNPAVSFAMLLTGRMSLLRFIVYSLGQFIGAFLGALITFVLYLDIMKSYGERMYDLNLAGIFATYPDSRLSVFGGFFDQTFATALLIIVVLAITDKRNINLQPGQIAILVGFTITLIGTSFAYNCGYAVNPARDFGPRLFTLIAGWGTQTFSAGHYFFWIPLVGPMVGSLVGVLLYTIMIGSHLDHLLE